MVVAQGNYKRRKKNLKNVEYNESYNNRHALYIISTGESPTSRPRARLFLYEAKKKNLIKKSVPPGKISL